MSIPTAFYAQKTIGVLGGMSNHATAEYYRMLNDEIGAANPGNTAELAIVSVNYGNIEYFVFNGLCGKQKPISPKSSTGWRRRGRTS